MHILSHYIKNLLIKVLYFSFFIGTIPQGIGQNNAVKASKEEKKLLKKGRKALANEDFIIAQNNYNELIQLNPNKDIYNFEAGLSYYFADNEREKSVPLFESALKNSKDDTIPKLYYYLARAYHFSGEYEKSEDAFEKLKPFIYKNTGSGKVLMKQSDYYIGLNKTATELKTKEITNVEIKNLGNKVNSEYGEYATVFGNSEDVILFTSRRPGSNNKTDKDLLPYEDIFVSKKSGDDWILITEAEEIEKYLPKRLNTKGHDAGVLYSSDGKTLYTYKNDVIWKSILENGQWSELVELDKNINNSQYNIPSISLSPDGNTIFFVSTQKSGFGAKDIYKSTKGVDGKWTTMENLGETINTEFDEDSPYITSDGKTLYFASKGHSGIGGYDIFKSELVDDKWSTPENIGIPINSPVDDIYYIIDKENTKGYISSNRNGGLGGMDIYSVCFECKEEQITNTIKGVIADESGNPINDGSISLLALSNKESNNSTVTSGKYEISTSNTGAHELTITSTNYENQKFNLTLPNKTSVSSVNFTLSQFSNENGKFQVLTVSSEDLGINKSDTIKVEETIASNDGNTNNNNSGTEQKTISETFYFDYNNKDIDNNSKLNEFINQAYTIGKNKTITIDIESSASKVPTNSFQTNYELARLRAVEAQKLIANLMVKKGINSNQLKFNKLKHSVNGPNYANDAANQDKYRNHQYVKISIK